MVSSEWLCVWRLPAPVVPEDPESVHPALAYRQHGAETVPRGDVYLDHRGAHLGDGTAYRVIADDVPCGVHNMEYMGGNANICLLEYFWCEALNWEC